MCVLTKRCNDEKCMASGDLRWKAAEKHGLIGDGRELSESLIQLARLECEEGLGLHLEDVVDDGPPGQRDVSDDGSDGDALHPLGLAPRVEYLRVAAHRPERVVLGLLELVQQVPGVDLARGVAQRLQVLVRVGPDSESDS